MKRALIFLVAVCAIALISSSVMAQSTVWLDMRDDASGGQNDITTAPTDPWINDGSPAIFNAGGPGDGQNIYVSPVHNDGHEATYGAGWPDVDGDSDITTVDIRVHVDVAPDAQDTGDVISSLGIDYNISEAFVQDPLSDSNRIATASYAWDAGISWNGTDPGASDGGDPPSVLGTKAVFVPVVAGPAYSFAGGMIPTATYLAGELTLTAALRSCATMPFNTAHAANSTYDLSMSVNNLLITRGFDPAIPNPGAYTPEQVSFGYTSGAPDVAIDGSVSGGSSAAVDAIIKVWVKGDFNGDGVVNGVDNFGYGAAFTGSPDDQDTTYRGDFSGDGVVNGVDNFGYGTAFMAHAGCS